MKILFVGISIAFLQAFSGKAQPYQKTSLGVKTKVNALEMEIQFYSPNLVRILKWPEGKTFTKESLSVIMAPQKIVFSIKQAGDELSITSKSLQVNLNLKNGRISYSTAKGQSLLNEKESGSIFTDFNDAGVNTYTVFQFFVLDKDEAIYGLVQQQGKMMQRNLKLNMVHGNTAGVIAMMLDLTGQAAMFPLWT